MLNILGYLIQLPPQYAFLLEPWVVFTINMAAWILIVLFLNLILIRALRFLARRFPGDLEDIVLAIIHRPIMVLIGLYGLTFSLRLLPLPQIVLHWLEIISYSVVVILIAQITGRFIKDILVYYGEKWAARTETHVDDVVVPVLNMFGPLVIGIAATLIILPLWGINVTSVLLGAGVLGLVLGLALQDTLGNVFSGMSLLIEAPFRKGDLIVIGDKKISEVLHLGLRSTTLFSLEDQATIFMPNKAMATNMLVNLTKPTPEQRHSIELTVGPNVELAKIQNMIFRIVNGHPAVLSSDMKTKCKHVLEQVEHIRHQASMLPECDETTIKLLAEAEKNQNSIQKLNLEGEFNAQILCFKESLRNLIRAISTRELNGLTEIERQDLYCNFVSPAERDIEETLHRSKAWIETCDPWFNDTDYWSQRKIWEKRNEQLKMHWEFLKKTIYHPDESREMRLDNTTKILLEWLEKEYKVPPGYWKDPVVALKNIGSASSVLEIGYYIDNIRLEHDSRPQRVRTELSRIIYEKMLEDNLWS